MVAFGKRGGDLELIQKDAQQSDQFPGADTIKLARRASRHFSKFYEKTLVSPKSFFSSEDDGNEIMPKK